MEIFANDMTALWRCGHLMGPSLNAASGAGGTSSSGFLGNGLVSEACSDYCAQTCFPSLLIGKRELQFREDGFCGIDCISVKSVAANPCRRCLRLVPPPPRMVSSSEALCPLLLRDGLRTLITAPASISPSRGAHSSAISYQRPRPKPRSRRPASHPGHPHNLRPHLPCLGNRLSQSRRRKVIGVSEIRGGGILVCFAGGCVVVRPAAAWS